MKLITLGGKIIKTLILSPHIDDEVLGAFSYLNESTTVIYFGYNEEHIVFDWVKSRPTSSTRLMELQNLKNSLKFDSIVLNHKINHYSLINLILDIEKYINQIKPDIILLPNPTYNQDHRSVYEAGLTSLRPHDVNHYVRIILVYEQIQDLWNHNYHQFKPTLFKQIRIEDKLKAYNNYKSQLRSFRSDEMIKTLSRIRGIQSNLEYAEAFEILRWVE